MMNSSLQGSGIKMHNILNKHLETTPTLGCTRMPVANEDSLESSRKHGKTYSLLLGYAPVDLPASSQTRWQPRGCRTSSTASFTASSFRATACAAFSLAEGPGIELVFFTFRSAFFQTHKTNSFENKLGDIQIQIEILVLFFSRKTKTKVRGKKQLIEKVTSGVTLTSLATKKLYCSWI